jgi:O-antigen/teichoic acid export membrane protein
MSLGRRLIGDTVVYGIALAVSRAAAFALLPVFTRVFSAAQYGVYDVAMALNRAMMVPAVLGTDSGIALLLRERDDVRHASAVTSCLLVQTVWVAALSVCLMALAPLVSGWLFGDPAQAYLIRLSAMLLFVLVLNYFSMNLAKWKRERGRYLLVTAGSIGFSAAASLIRVLWFDRSVAGALEGLVIGNAVFVPIGLLLMRRHMAPAVALEDIGRCLRLGLPFAATGATEFIQPFLFRLVLIYTAGLEAVGVFGAANTICLGVMLINDAFASAWWPYALSSEGIGRVEADTERVMRLYSVLLLLVVAGLLLSAGPIVAVFLGGGVYSQAAGVVGPIAFAYWLKSVRQNANVGLVVVGRTWTRASLNLATALAAVVVAYPLAASWGIAGVAWGFGGAEMLGLMLQSLVMRRASVLSLDVGAMLTAALLFVALALLESELPASSPGLEIIWRFALGGAFVGSLLISGAIRVAEIRAVVAVIRGIGPVPRARNARG